MPLRIDQEARSALRPVVICNITTDRIAYTKLVGHGRGRVAQPSAHLQARWRICLQPQQMRITRMNGLGREPIHMFSYKVKG